MKTSQVYNTLVNEGPKTANELGSTPNQELRQDGVRMFILRSNPCGAGMHGGGVKTAVYYIEGKHTAESVIQKWLDVNPKSREKLSDRALHWRICRRNKGWKDASYEIFGPFQKQNSQEPGGKTEIESCPLCGTEISVDLPSHLPCEE